MNRLKNLFCKRRVGGEEFLQQLQQLNPKFLTKKSSCLLLALYLLFGLTEAAPAKSNQKSNSESPAARKIAKKEKDSNKESDKDSDKENENSKDSDKKSDKDLDKESEKSKDSSKDSGKKKDKNKDKDKDADKDNDSKADKKKKKSKKKDKDSDSQKDNDNDKSDKSKEKGEKGDKGDKNDKKDSKEKAGSDDESEKKKGGLFHLGKKKSEESENKESKGDDKADTKAKEAESSQKASKPKVKEDPNAPKYKFDPALISVLKDINKSLKDSEAVSKLEDPTQKLVAKLAAEALEKALSASDLHANRIVENRDKDLMASSMSAEAWESGDLEVNPELKASLTALWAKKLDGLLTIQIVGNYQGKAEGTNEPLGEFIVVITALSSVDKGFDIQSQQDVSFWIGKVAELKIDCKKSEAKEESSDEKKDIQSLLLQLYVPITERKRAHLIAAKEYNEKLANEAEEKKKAAEIAAAVQAQQKQVAEVLAKTVAEALAKSVGSKTSENNKVAATGGKDSEKKAEGSSELAEAENSEAPEKDKAHELAETPESVNSKAAQNSSSTQSQNQNQDLSQSQNQNQNQNQNLNQNLQTNNGLPFNNNTGPSPAAGKSNTLASLFPDASRNTRSNWESPGTPSTVRPPSPNASLIYPGRAVAGQYMTVAVLGRQNVGEQFVALQFNGSQHVTGANGRVVYEVPEDAAPGFSMHVSLADRPEEAAGAVEILQPLASPSSPQTPNLEGVSPVCSRNGSITISGHNFDGIAERNRVIVDGAYDANVIVSSPVQLKAQVPPGISAGTHSLCVSTAGLRSNPGNFDLVTVDLLPVGPDTAKNELKKLLVKVQGTQNRVRVKLSNQSRDVIKLVKGDEVVLVTPGGAKNEVTVPVQRLQPGNYNITAEILI